MSLMLKNYPSKSCLKAYPISAKVKNLGDGKYEIYVAEHLAEKWKSAWELYKANFIFKVAGMAYAEAAFSPVHVDIYFGDEDAYLHVNREFNR